MILCTHIYNIKTAVMGKSKEIQSQTEPWLTRNVET